MRGARPILPAVQPACAGFGGRGQLRFWHRPELDLDGHFLSRELGGVWAALGSWKPSSRSSPAVCGAPTVSASTPTEQGKCQGRGCPPRAWGSDTPVAQSARAPCPHTPAGFTWALGTFPSCSSGGGSELSPLCSPNRLSPVLPQIHGCLAQRGRPRLQRDGRRGVRTSQPPPLPPEENLC